MKRLNHFLPLTFVLASYLFFVWTLVSPVSVAKAAPPVLHLPQMSSAHYVLDWSTVGGASGGEAASANYKLSGTIGQMAASNRSASANDAACSGFQCVLDALRVYLPMIRR